MDRDTSPLLEMITPDAFMRTAERPMAIIKEQESSCHSDMSKTDVGENFTEVVRPLAPAIAKMKASIISWAKASSGGQYSAIMEGTIVATLLWVNEALKAANGEEDIASIIARVGKGD